MCDTPVLANLKVARDVDGSGNYLILAHKHVAQVHPLSVYGPCFNKLGLPEWVLFHEYAPAENNCMRTVTQISPQAFTRTAPVFYFYNLPQSESKDILRDILDPNATGTLCEEHKSRNRVDDNGGVPSTDRCVVQ